MTLRQLLNKNLEIESVYLDYDGCECWYDSEEEFEVEAFEYGFIDEEVKNWMYSNRSKKLKIEM